MKWIIVINIVLAGILFFMNGFIGKLQYNMGWNLFPYGKFAFESEEESNFTGNFFLKIVNPTIFLYIIAWIGQRLGQDVFVAALWMFVPIYWLWRLGYIALKNLFVFLNLKYEGIACIVSLALGEGVFFIIIKPLLNQNESLWISTTELRDGLWFAIIIYIATSIWNIMKKAFSGDVLYPASRRWNMVQKRYDVFERRYGKYILDELSRRIPDDELREQKAKISYVLYAIMIYEDYNRPKIVRIIEYVIKVFSPHKKMTLGIMQVGSYTLISDKTSIKLALNRIIPEFFEEDDYPEQNAISNYNDGEEYYAEVLSIYSMLYGRFSDEIFEDAG